MGVALRHTRLRMSEQMCGESSRQAPSLSAAAVEPLHQCAFAQVGRARPA